MKGLIVALTATAIGAIFESKRAIEKRLSDIRTARQKEAAGRNCVSDEDQ